MPFRHKDNKDFGKIINFVIGYMASLPLSTVYNIIIEN